jgi:hypothetical protein
MLVVSIIISDLSLGKFHRLHADEHHNLLKTWLEEIE